MDKMIDADKTENVAVNDMKEFIAIAVPLTPYEIERTLWIIADCIMNGTTTGYVPLVSKDMISIVLNDKETNGLITPIKSVSLTREEMAILDRIKEKWECRIHAKEDGFTVIVAEKDRTESLMSSINDGKADEMVRTPKADEMIIYLRKEDADKVEKTTSSYMI